MHERRAQRRHGLRDQADTPNYWAYAKTFTLQDHMFEPNASWLPSHLLLVSEWSAPCTTKGDPMSCHSNIDLTVNLAGSYDYAWTDLTYLLHKERRVVEVLPRSGE